MGFAVKVVILGSHIVLLSGKRQINTY